MTKLITRSEARNRLLVDLLARTNFMEKAGTGIKRVSDACISNGNRVDFDFSDSFWITMHTNMLDEKSNNDTDKVVDNDTDNDTDNRFRRIIEIMKNHPKITTKKISESLNVSQITIKRDIEKLKTLNRLARIGSEKSGYWQIIYNK